MRARSWKLLGLGAIAAIAAGTAIVVERRKRRWREYDAGEIRARLHERFAALETPSGQQPR